MKKLAAGDKLQTPTGMMITIIADKYPDKIGAIYARNGRGFQIRGSLAEITAAVEKLTGGGTPRRDGEKEGKNEKIGIETDRGDI